MKHLRIYLMVIAAGMFSAFSFAGTLEEGYQAVRGGNPEQSYAILKPLADGGNADAQYAVAVLYREGWGTEQSMESAANYYQQAAEGDHRDSMFEVGWLYQAGQGGLTKDYEKAAMWYKKAAEKGHPAAMYGLASFYYNGMGVKMDTDSAMSCIKKLLLWAFHQHSNFWMSSTK